MEVTTGFAWERTFYEINVPNNAQQLSIELQFSHSGGDLDLYLFDSQGNQIESALSATDNESITIANLTAGTYYVVVEPYEVTGNGYRLEWSFGGGFGGGGGRDDNYEPNNTISAAYDLSNQNGNWLSTIAGEGIGWDDDYYQINVPNNAQELSIELQFSHSGGDLDLYVYNSQGNQIESALSVTDNESITIANPTAGNYYIQVKPYQVTGNNYDLKWSAVDSSGGGRDDNYEPNNTISAAYDLSNQNGNWLSTIAGEGIGWDDDYYQINVPNNAQELSIELQFSHSGGDLDLYVYNSQGNQIESALSVTDNESITIPAFLTN